MRKGAKAGPGALRAGGGARALSLAIEPQIERPFLAPRQASEQKLLLLIVGDESEPDIRPLPAGHLPQGQQQPRAQILS